MTTPPPLRPLLLVEDNPDDELLTLHALKSNNIAIPVVVARDGVEALDYLFGEGAHAGRDTQLMPTLVLLDLKLPRIDGLEVLRRLRAHPQTELLPIVILTTSREPRDLREAYRLGVNSYIRKPVDFDQFTHAIGQLGRYWLGLNELPDL